MSNKGKRIQDLPPPVKSWPKPEARQVLAEPAAAATPRSYGQAIRRTQGESRQPGPSQMSTGRQPGGQFEKKEAKRQEQKAEEKARKLEGVKQRMAAKRGGVPQLPVPRPAHVLKQQQKDGWKEEDEFAEVDVYGKELFVKSSKQALPKGFGC